MLESDMTSLDFLYYSLGVGFLILVGFVSYTALSLSETLKRSTSILIKIDDLAKDADNLKNMIKNGVLGLLNIFSGKATGSTRPTARRGGEKT